MRGVSREVLARDAAWSLADGSCKDLTIEWARWEATYVASATAAARQTALVEPAAECADLAELSGYTGIAAGQGYRNGRLDHARQRHPNQRRTA